MQKTNFTFFSFAVNHFTRRLQTRRKLVGTAGLRRCRQAKTCCKNLLAGAKQPLLKTSAALCIALAMHLPATAQCDTFRNANMANPLLSVIPGGVVVRSLNFVDIDNDGDLDAYVNTYSYSNRAEASRRPVLYRNIGSQSNPQFQLDANSGFTTDVSNIYVANIQFVDIDGDGDYDCFLNVVADYRYHTTGIRYFKNIGTAAQPDFVEDAGNNPVAFARSYGTIPFTFADIDGDGDLDFYYHHSYYGSYANTDIYKNTGTKTMPVYHLDTSIVNQDFYSHRTYYDWNKDGLLDYFSFDFNGTNFFKNLGPKSNPQYISDNMEGPVFQSGEPDFLVDLNNDGVIEAFTRNGDYVTVTPIAIIDTATVMTGNKQTTKLFSRNKSASYQYSWAYKGKMIPNYHQPYIYALQPGRYTLFVKDNCGTGVSLGYVKQKNTVIADQILADAIHPYAQALPGITVKAYPNPFVNEITVQLGSAKATVVNTIKVTDLAGRVMLVKTSSSASVSIGKNLPAGTYILQVFQNNSMIYHTMIVKPKAGN